MPREHATMNMTLEELANFLGTQTRCIVGTLDAEAGPWGDAAACVFQDGALYFRIPRKARSLANLQRDSRVCCVMEDHPTGSDYYTIKGAILHGRATIVADPATARRVASALDQLSDPVTGKPAPDGTVFTVGIDDVASFDFAKIKRRFES